MRKTGLDLTMDADGGRERRWPSMTRQHFDDAPGPDGAIRVGSPDTVTAKIVRVAHAGAVRFDPKYSAGPLPHEQLMTCIELYGTKLALGGRGARRHPNVTTCRR